MSLYVNFANQREFRSKTAVEQLCLAHFTRAQVGVVCETQIATVRLWVRCVVTLHLKHTSPRCHLGQAHSLSFCPSRSLPAVRQLGYHRQPTVLGVT